MIFIIIWMAGLAGMFLCFMFPMLAEKSRKAYTDEFGNMATVIQMSFIISALWPVWWAIELLIKKKENRL